MGEARFLGEFAPIGFHCPICDAWWPPEKSRCPGCHVTHDELEAEPNDRDVIP